MFGPLATAPLSDAPFSTFCSAKIAINRPKIVRAKSPMALQVSKGSTMRLPPIGTGGCLSLGGGTIVSRRREKRPTAEGQMYLGGDTGETHYKIVAPSITEIFREKPRTEQEYAPLNDGAQGRSADREGAVAGSVSVSRG